MCSSHHCRYASNSTTTMSTSKTNEQAFEALIERALVGTTIEERKEAGQTDVDAQCPSESQYYWGLPGDFDKKVALDRRR